MGTASPTTFDAGGFDYDQLVLNFSAVRSVRRRRVRLAAQRRDRPRSARRSVFDLRRRAELVPQRRRAAAERRSRRRRARRCSRASVRRTRSTRTAPRSAPTSTWKRTSRRSSSAPSPLRGEDYSDFGEQRLRQARGALRLHRGVRAARLGADRLPRAVAAAAVLRDDVDELHRRRAVRHHDVPGQRPGRARARRAGPRRRGSR